MIIQPTEFKVLSTQGKRVGITSGCFDLLHFYHLHYLERCRAECDILVVGVDSDQLVMLNKRKQPNIPEHHRGAVVAALKCVDAVFVMRNLATQYGIDVMSVGLAKPRRVKTFVIIRTDGNSNAIAVLPT